MELGNTTATDRYLTIQTGQSLSGVRLRNLSANSGWTVLNNPTSPAGSALQFLFHNLDPVGAPQMSLTQLGYLGIGTTTPLGRLDVRDGPVTLTVNGNQDRVTMYLTGGSGNLAIKNNSGNVVASMTSSDYGAGPSGEFRVNNSSGQYRGGISVNANGKCVVEGDIVKINGGADIAESFDVLSAGAVAPQPGMVVSIDAGGSGKLRVSHAAYDRAVAGIISGADGINPGLTLGQKGSIADGEYPVAMTGRVYVFVDAEAGGPVKPGDLLTTSATPGYAMRVTDFSAAPGATIGKAMTGLESGRGLVLVLVGLR